MVEYNPELDSIFSSLSDPTRRDIFLKLSEGARTVSDIASEYKMSLAGISKHLKVLQKAKLITKRRDGRQQIVESQPISLVGVDEFLRDYRRLWDDRLDRLEELLIKEQRNE
ncbi:MAG TPA: metalloregulator ArsR/SmtB family transcription factor [Candidatus Saccharimonadales bacterium]